MTMQKQLEGAQEYIRLSALSWLFIIRRIHEEITGTVEPFQGTIPFRILQRGRVLLKVRSVVNVRNYTPGPFR